MKMSGLGVIVGCRSHDQEFLARSLWAAIQGDRKNARRLYSYITSSITFSALELRRQRSLVNYFGTKQRKLKLPAVGGGVMSIHEQRLKLAADLGTLKDLAGRLGLWRTMHALDGTTKEIGWEIADIMSGKQADTCAKTDLVRSSQTKTKDNLTHG